MQRPEAPPARKELHALGRGRPSGPRRSVGQGGVTCGSRLPPGNGSAIGRPFTLTSHDGSHDSFHCVSASQPTPSTHRTRVARAAARGSTRRSRCPGGPWRGARRATASAGCPCPPPGPPCAGGEDGVGVVAAHSGIAHPHTSKLPQQTATNCTQSVPPRHLRTAARAWPAVTLAPLAASIWMRVRTTSSGWTREAALDPAAGIRARWWTQ